MSRDPPNSDFLRVSLHEQDLQSLMHHFPKLTRTEISDVVMKHGPLRATVEAELKRVSSTKR